MLGATVIINLFFCHLSTMSFNLVQRKVYSDQKRRLAALSTVSSSLYLLSQRYDVTIDPTSGPVAPLAPIPLVNIPRAPQAPPPAPIRIENARAATAVMAKKLKIRMEWVPPATDSGLKWQNCFCKFRIIIAWRNRPKALVGESIFSPLLTEPFPFPPAPGVEPPSLLIRFMMRIM